MFKVLYVINLLRSFPVYIMARKSNVFGLLRLDLEKYRWYVNASKQKGFFSVFNKLMLRDKCFRNLVIFRLTSSKKIFGYITRFLFPCKDDLEIHGEIGGGCAIYHGHGTVITPSRIGENFSIYQGVTIGKNRTEGRNFDTQIIGNDVTIYTNAVVVGGIYIGDNVIIGAGTVVTKDVPSNSIVKGNPCVIRKIKENTN